MEQGRCGAYTGSTGNRELFEIYRDHKLGSLTPLFHGSES